MIQAKGAFTARHQKLGTRFALLLTVLGASSTAIAGPPQSVAKAAEARVMHWLQVGQASWYGLKLQGHRTASGEPFDAKALTCAHRTLPFGSLLRVTNLKNMKSVLVRVTDRGPIPKSRVVDLSQAAARVLELGGTGRVKVESVVPPTLTPMASVDAIVSKLEAPKPNLMER